jgi:hypothetical protein
VHREQPGHYSHHGEDSDRDEVAEQRERGRERALSIERAVNRVIAASGDRRTGRTGNTC